MEDMLECRLRCQQPLPVLPEQYHCCWPDNCLMRSHQVYVHSYLWWVIGRMFQDEVNTEVLCDHGLCDHIPVVFPQSDLQGAGGHWGEDAVGSCHHPQWVDQGPSTEESSSRIGLEPQHCHPGIVIDHCIGATNHSFMFNNPTFYQIKTLLCYFYP